LLQVSTLLEAILFYGSQSEFDESLKEGSTPYAAFWAPNTYSYGSRLFCTGLDAHFVWLR
jgi:hypothetical protein